LAIQGLEWIIVAVIVLVFFLWGPEKLPKLARSLGQAKREFERASREAEQQISSVTTGISEEIKRQEDQLLEVARSLGLSTEGKTREQIADEIVARLKQKV
jgi:sec-independent protein translocase protein TatA